MSRLDERRFRRDPRAILMPDRSRGIAAAGMFGLALDRLPHGSHRCRHSGPAASEAAESPLSVRPQTVIETPRLILRRHAAADFDAYREMCSDPAMARYAGRSPAGSEEAWMRLLRHVGHWSLTGYGFLAIEDKKSGRLAGEAGVGDFKRRLGPAFDEDPEAGWAIAPWAQGRGYATEAAAAVLEWIETAFGVRRTVCIIHVANVASTRVAEKLGYRPIGTCTYRDYPARTFERRS